MVHLSEALNLLMLGQTRRAASHIEEAEDIAVSTGHVQTICASLGHRVSYSLMSDDLPDAERCLNKVAPIAEEHNLVHWMNSMSRVAEVLAAHKGDKSSITRFWKLDASGIAAKFKLGAAQWRVDIARSALAMGLREEAVELAMMAQELIDETGETYALSDLHRVQAAIAIAADDTETAEQCLVMALDVARRQGGKLWELRAAIDLAGLWRDQGKTAEAISLLQPVHDSIAEGDCPEDRATAGELLSAMAG